MSSMSPVLCFTAEDIHEHFPPQLQDWFRDHQQVVSAEPSSDEQLFSIFQYGWYNSSKHADEWLSAESEANYQVRFCRAVVRQACAGSEFMTTHDPFLVCQNWERARQLRSSVLTLLEQVGVAQGKLQPTLASPDCDLCFPNRRAVQDTSGAPQRLKCTYSALKIPPHPPKPPNYGRNSKAHCSRHLKHSWLPR